MDGARLLIAGDEAIQELVLGTRRAMDLVCARTAKDTKRWLFAQDRFDALILEVLLPDGHGVELLAELRGSTSPNALVPALLIGERDDLHVVNVTFDLEARLIVRPLTPERLEQFIINSCPDADTPACIHKAVQTWTLRYGLTPCESEILGLAALGRSRVAIISARGGSPHTFKRHVSGLLAKTMDDTLEGASVRLLCGILSPNNSPEPDGWLGRPIHGRTGPH